MMENHGPEETLDPENWEEFRELGHKMLDDMIDYHQQIRSRSVWKPFDNILQNFKSVAPAKPEGLEKAYNDFLELVRETSLGNALSPRWWGWVVGTGTPSGMLADMLTGAINDGPDMSTGISYHINGQVLNWIKEMVSYPKEASGILVSGTSTADLIGLTVARNEMSGYDVRKLGLKHDPQNMVLYCSTETHMAIQKAFELLGLGKDNLRFVPVDSEFKLDVAELKKSIAADREKGFKPFCVVGNAGTVNTGAFDDLGALADICRAEKLWFHVDAAFGVWVTLSTSLRHLAKGIERADSIGLDLHKWMNMTYDCACVLVRNEAAHLRTFALTPDYLKISEGIPSACSDYGTELSTRLRALKVWMCIKENGTEKYGRIIEQNVEQTRFLEGLIRSKPELEVLAPASLNIVCFRYKVDGLSEAELGALNNTIWMSLAFNGSAMPSSTSINGKFAIRFCNVNHRTKREDLVFLVDEVIRLGRELQNPDSAAKVQNRANEFFNAISQK
jgi:aromatic-L-amino-acid decarboxylase